MPKSFAQKLFGQTLLKATQLTGKGQLMDATRLIQRALGNLNPLPVSQPVAPKAANPAAPVTSRKAVNDDDIIDVQAHEVTARSGTSPASPGVLKEATEAFKQAFFPSHQDNAAKPANAPFTRPDQAAPAQRADNAFDAPSAAPEAATQTPASYVRRPSAFTEGVTQFKGDQYPYRLYLPAGPKSADASAATKMPLVVLLHGCKQDALDFATGTEMNGLGDQQQFAVLYPQQISKANAGSCWNWFETENQTRSGEPGMIAALVKKIVAASYDGLSIDPDRIYIAGLSAGGAMATITAGLYPEVFAAVGVHSGLPAGSANSMIGAFSAMRRGNHAGEAAANAVPTIVFHGTQDQTVHPDNGEHISASALAALKKDGVVLEKTESKVSNQAGKPAVRTAYHDANGKAHVEHWQVSQGGHAWFGGAAAGSYTDPQAPSASKAMLAFFLQHKKSTKVSGGAG